MKKVIFGLFTAGLLITLNPVQSSAAVKDSPGSVVMVKTEETAEVKALLLRLDAINAIDKSDLKSAEKKDLRVEVRSIKNQLQEIGGGIYLSAGAIIIIIILILILF